ncbi:MAG: efflux transporter outer membrane subunit [Gammaproteobacteria bacterium]
MNTNLLCTAVLGTCLLFAGCATVGPDFQQPEAEVAGNWLEAEDPNVDTTQVTYQDWWTVFDDPVLNELTNYAYSQNLTLQIAGLRILEARAQLGIASGLRYPQSQSVQASAARSRSSENAPPFSNLPSSIGDNIDNSVSFWSTSFDVAWEADVWGRFRRGIEAADANLAANMLSYDAMLVTLTGDVALTYTTIRTLQLKRAYALSNVIVQRLALDLAETRFELGVTSELDVQQAISLLEATEASIPLLVMQIRWATNVLSLLLGMPPSDLVDILGSEGTLPMAPVQAAVGIPADLIRRRPDVRAAEMAAAAQSAAIGVSTAELYPHFVLAGSVGLAGETFSDQFDSGSGTGFVAPFVHWNIFNYGRIKNNVRIQDARFQQLVMSYQNVVLNAAREVEDGLAGFIRAKESVGHMAQAAIAAERAVELSLDQYEAGIVDYQRVINSQTVLLQYQDGLADVQGLVVSSLVSTYRALGGGWQLRQGNAYVDAAILETMRDRTDWGELLDDQTEPTHLAPAGP